MLREGLKVALATTGRIEGRWSPQSLRAPPPDGRLTTTEIAPSESVSRNASRHRKRTGRIRADVIALGRHDVNWSPGESLRCDFLARALNPKPALPVRLQGTDDRNLPGEFPSVDELRKTLLHSFRHRPLHASHLLRPFRRHVLDRNLSQTMPRLIVHAGRQAVQVTGCGDKVLASVELTAAQRADLEFLAQ